MASLTNQEIKQLQRQYEQKLNEVKELRDKLVEAGAYPIDDDALDVIAGGIRSGRVISPQYTDSTDHSFR